MEKKLGKVIIAPGVLVTIARLTTLSTPGVVRMSAGWTDSMGRLLRRRGPGDGVRIEVEDNTVSVDLYIVVEQDVNILKLSQDIQSEVSRAIHDMVGMEIKEVNIHIQDVEIPLSED
ncbi:MAG: Asp23/Gls24 family envelope stress response protein [Anaerolineales bacterium]|nr:Asp23/Gls24 family envelope stress response protein [Anaerolineales bacterium]